MKILRPCPSGGWASPPHFHPGLDVTFQPFEVKAKLPMDGGRATTSLRVKCSLWMKRLRHSDHSVLMKTSKCSFIWNGDGTLKWEVDGGMGTGDPKQAEMDDNPVIEITGANRNVRSQIKNINAQFGTRSRIFHKPALGH